MPRRIQSKRAERWGRRTGRTISTDKSLEQLEAAVRSSPRDERARLTLARVLIQAGRLQDAERVLRETIAILPILDRRTGG